MVKGSGTSSPELSTVCLGCHQWVILLFFFFIVLNVMSLSGCTPQLTPPQSSPSQITLFPVIHLSWAPWRLPLIYLTLSSKSQVTMTISIRKDTPALSVRTIHSLPWTVVFRARPWPRLGLDTNDQILHVWALVLFVLNLLVGIINTTEPTSK